MWLVPGLPPLGSFLARMRDRRRDVGRHVDFWKLFLLYLLISFVGRSWGCGHISGTAEVWRSKDNLKQSVFLLPCGSWGTQATRLSGKLDIYLFIFSGMYLRSGHHILWFPGMNFEPYSLSFVLIHYHIISMSCSCLVPSEQH